VSGTVCKCVKLAGMAQIIFTECDFKHCCSLCSLDVA